MASNSYFNSFHPFLLSLIGGIFYASGFPLEIGHSFFLGPLIGFFLFNYVLWEERLKEGRNLKKQMLLALCFSIGFYLLGFYWIPQTLKEFGGLFFPMNQILGIIFSLIIIPQVYIYTAIQRKINHPALLAITYVLLEEFVPQQFPAHLGHSFLSLTPYFPLRLTSLFGAPVYSFFTAYLALSLLNHFKTKKIPIISYVLLGILALLNFILPPPSKGAPLAPLNVRLVQPNIGNFLKIDSEHGGVNSLRSVFDSYYELSTRPSLKPLDLIIWPETSFPTLLSSEIMKKNNDLKIPGLLSQIIKKTQAELFIGGYDLNSNSRGDYQNQYNTAFLFGPDQMLKNVYHKIRLIPFGESLPFGPFNKILSRYITNIAYFAEGESFSLFRTKNNTPFISVICYEVLFSHFLREFLNEQKSPPQFLINLTNDSWYGDTAELHQHLFLAKWKALEFNIPIIRSTNTGITTIIMPDASESPRLNYHEKKILDIELNLNERDNTIYQRFGLWMILALALIFYLIEKKFQRL